jgi:hypothetical protein
LIVPIHASETFIARSIFCLRVVEFWRAALRSLAKDQVVWLDMEGTADSGYAKTNNLIGRFDPSKPVLIASFSDEQLAGALRALSVAGRSDLTLAVGICKVDPKLVCRDAPVWRPDDAVIDEGAYKAFVADPHRDPTFANFKMPPPPPA